MPSCLSSSFDVTTHGFGFRVLEELDKERGDEERAGEDPGPAAFLRQGLPGSGSAEPTEDLAHLPAVEGLRRGAADVPRRGELQQERREGLHVGRSMTPTSRGRRPSSRSREVAGTHDTKRVTGVECVVIRDKVFLNGSLIEDTFDWYAQNKEGNV